jgi:23S rRNA pseudouridine1911/1915/1917 synthase
MNGKIEIIYEDADYLIISKPAGILVHSSKNSANSEKTVVDWLREHRPEVKDVGDNPQERPGIVHRLDRDTSGVLLIAKNNQSFAHLKNLFQSGKIKKSYLALVWGKINGAGKINKPIGLRSGTTKRSVQAKNMKMIKEAITEYKAIQNFEHFTLLRVFPKTGRTHQIRVHLASIGHAIVGDLLYGPKKKVTGLSRQFLHAESIEFTSLNGSRIRVEAELPEELKLFLESLTKEE